MNPSGTSSNFRMIISVQRSAAMTDLRGRRRTFCDDLLVHSRRSHRWNVPKSPRFWREYSKKEPALRIYTFFFRKQHSAVVKRLSTFSQISLSCCRLPVLMVFVFCLNKKNTFLCDHQRMMIKLNYLYHSLLFKNTLFVFKVQPYL